MPITQITRLGLVNAYLVAEDDGLTLVDTMIPRSEKAILAAAERLGAPIVRIALTHAHGDHIGSLDALAAALPDAEVLISARDARLLAKDKTPTRASRRRKLRGGYPGARRARRARSRPATASARWRSSPPRAHARATSRSSTRATAR